MTKIPSVASGLLPVKKTAAALHTSKWTVYRWIKEGKLIGIEFGGVLLVPLSEIERFDNGRRGRLP
jgi:excisionase family DNA binding protein